MKRILSILFAVILASACPGPVNNGTGLARERYTNPIYPSGSSPFLLRHNGYYYYTQTMNDHVSIWKSADIGGIRTAHEHVVYAPGTYHFSAPRLCRLDGKWYLYFSSDDGTGSDVRHIYVMENIADDPLEGSFVMKGWIRTGNVKDIHPDIFEHRGKRYLLWAGTGVPGEGGTAIWKIYIAQMDTPWCK